MLVEFCNLNKLDFIDKCLLPSSYFTFISQAHGTISWLDHCITTAAGRSIISDAYNNNNNNNNIYLKSNIQCT